MNNTATYFKWSVVLIIFIGLLWMRWQCTHKTGGTQVTVKRDTTYVNTRDTILIDHPVPYKVTYVEKKVLHDTLETIETILQHVDSARILEQYLAMKFYSESSGVKYGTVTVNDTVTQNRIVGRSIILDQNIPVVKETVTLTQPKRVVLYFSIGAIGNMQNLPYASGAGFGLKLKSDAMIEGMGYLTQDKAMYGISFKFPIRLKKR